MIRRLIILLLIVSAFAHEEMDALEKQMLYKQNDKSPLLAGLCAFTPTMGHLYLGEWNKRRLLRPELLLPLGSYASYVVSEVVHEKARDVYWDYWDYEGNNYGWNQSSDREENRRLHSRANNIELFGIISFSIYYYLQFQDAIYLAYQHNADLYEEIYGKEYIRPPKKSLIQKWIDKKEAKKKEIDTN